MGFFAGQGLRAGCAAWALSCACLLGCGRERAAALLDLSSAGPSVLERGDHLRVLGAGLPAGREGVVELDGVVHVPAAASVRVHVALVAQVVAPDRVDVALDQAAAQPLPRRGSFDGSLTLRFAGAQAGTQVLGRLPKVQLDWLGTASASEEQALRARALEWLERAGVSPLDTESAREGLVVAQLRRDGPAERAGLAVGDVIESAAGVRVHALSDLAPAADVRKIGLQLTRAGRQVQVSLDLAQLSPADALVAARMQRRVLLAVLCALCVLFVGPFQSPSTFVARWRSRYSMLGGRPPIFGELAPGAASASGLAGRLRAALVPVACSLLACVFAVLGASARVQIDAAWVLLSYFALLVIVYVRQPRRLLRLSAQASVLALSFACVAATHGTRALASLVAGQGVYPWAWNVFTRPQLALGFVLFVVHGARMLAALGSERQPHTSAALALDVSGRLVLALSAAALFLGGWNVPSGVDSELGRSLLGALLLAAKAWLVAWLLGLVRALALGAARRAWLAWLPAAAMLLLTALWLLVPALDALAPALGAGLFGLCAGTLALALLEVSRAGARLGRPPTHPAPFA